MNLTIYFKNSTGPKEGLTFGFTEEEYYRLRDDFESFLKDGSPKGGLYLCRSIDQRNSSEVNKVLIEFNSVALIDVRVQMEKVDEALRQPPIVPK
jgi:hypothetical protein